MPGGASPTAATRAPPSSPGPAPLRQVTLTAARAEHMQERRCLTNFSAGSSRSAPSRWRPSAGEQVERSPIILAAVDVRGRHAANCWRRCAETVRRIAQTEPGARLACVGVMRTARIGMDELTDQCRPEPARQALVGSNTGAADQNRSTSATKAGQRTFHVLEAPGCRRGDRRLLPARTRPTMS